MKAAVSYALAVSLAGLPLSGCSRLDQNREAKQLVERQLKDPDSAQFTEIVKEAKASCGYVNSKNGFGAYSGREAFVVADGDVSFDDTSPNFRTLVRHNCDSSFFSTFETAKARQAVKEIDSDMSSLRAAGIIK
jgi:hypothetical protein